VDDRGILRHKVIVTVDISSSAEKFFVDALQLIRDSEFKDLLLFVKVSENVNLNMVHIQFERGWLHLTGPCMRNDVIRHNWLLLLLKRSALHLQHKFYRALDTVFFEFCKESYDHGKSAAGYGDKHGYGKESYGHGKSAAGYGDKHGYGKKYGCDKGSYDHGSRAAVYGEKYGYGKGGHGRGYGKGSFGSGSRAAGYKNFNDLDTPGDTPPTHDNQELPLAIRRARRETKPPDWFSS
jgi:hypothetical protein